MGLLGPNVEEVKALREQGDVVGLVRLYGSTKRRDTRQATIAALQSLGEPARQTVLAALDDEELQRTAAATLVEIGTESLADATALLSDEDDGRRAGALYAVYYYARYRDDPAAFDILRRTAARAGSTDVTEAAAGMLQRAETLKAERDRHIDALLEKIALHLQEEAAQPQTTIVRMYSTRRRDRVNAMNELLSMRYACLPRVLERAGEFGDTAVAALLGLALNEIRGGVVPPISGALRTGDKRAKSVFMRTLLCLRHAGVPGADEAIDESGIRVTEGLDRQAAKVYKEWVKR